MHSRPDASWREGQSIEHLLVRILGFREHPKQPFEGPPVISAALWEKRFYYHWHPLQGIMLGRLDVACCPRVNEIVSLKVFCYVGQALLGELQLESKARVACGEAALDWLLLEYAIPRCSRIETLRYVVAKE